MIKTLLIVIATTGLFSCRQANRSTPDNIDVETVNSIRNYEYADSMGKQLIIQNSLPKGERYIAPNGKQYFKVIFWTRIINETDNTLEFKIDFPAFFNEVSELPGNEYKVLVANDTMTIDKEPLRNYGFKDFNSFLDSNIDKQTSLRRKIGSNTSSGFYVAILSYSTNNIFIGALRTGFKLKGQDVIYKISRYAKKPEFSLISEKEIKCGSINLKSLVRKK